MATQKVAAAATQAKSKQPRKVKYGDGSLTFIKGRNQWRKCYYVEILEGDEIKRVKRSVHHADMLKAVELANERIAESESWWRTPKPAPVFGPNFGLARQADRIEMTVPTQRLDFFPTVADTYMGSRIKWRADGSQSTLKAGTRKKYTSWINNSMDPALGSLALVPMRNLTLDGDIDPHFKRYLATHDPDTAMRYRGFLIGIGKYAEDLDIWPKNLFAKLPPIAGSALTTEKRILSPEELDRLYAAAVDPGFKTEKMRTSALAALRLLRLGLRPAEVFALSMDDILDDNTVRVNYAQTTETPDWFISNPYPEMKFTCYLDDPKTTASIAQVTIPRVFLKDVQEASKYVKSHAVPAYDDAPGEAIPREFLVPNLQGFAWLQNNARRVIEDLFEYAGVSVAVAGGSNNRSLYCFRYTYASELSALGADDVAMMALMRHRDANLSKTVYAKARASYLDIYREYSKGIQSLTDYNKVIAQMDLDRASKSGPWANYNVAKEEQPKQRQKYKWPDLHPLPEGPN